MPLVPRPPRFISRLPNNTNIWFLGYLWMEYHQPELREDTK